MSVNEENKNTCKKTLLQKYDMVVECLSFEHIEKCCKVKEIEKILKVLRSGEEGHYPHLEKAAEDKLRKLAPNNHLLRIETPVISTSALAVQDRQIVCNDMQKWAQEMSSRESLLRSGEYSNVDEAPAVRNSSVAKTVVERNKMNKSTSPKPKEKSLRKCAPNDYTFWDKFDADSEVLKMDLEEERLAEKKSVERKLQEEYQILKTKQTLEEENALRDRLMDSKNSVGAGDGLSVPEREHNALQEKIKGNEYFRDRDLMKALDHYTLSISFLPNVDAYNNRALTYLKLKDYSSAVQDCKSVLSLDAGNVKAFYRRGSALFFQEKYQEALDDFEAALEISPNDKEVQDFAQRAITKLGVPVSSKRVRVAIQNKDPSNVVEVDSVEKKDKYYPFFNTSPNDDIALNAIGTAKVMCRCNGTPGFMKKVRSLDDIKDHGRLCLRRNSRSQKKELSQGTQSSSINLAENFKPAQESAGVISSIGCPKPQKNNTSKNMGINRQSLKSMPTISRTSLSNMSGTNIALSNLEKLKSPFSFSVLWSLIKNVDDLPSVAKALQVLCPEQIAQVVGNKLEEKMLSSFILALRTHFSLPDEWGIVQRYLHSFTQLPRFSIVNMMLDKTTKTELEMLLNDAESQGLRVSDLLQLYGLTT